MRPQEALNLLPSVLRFCPLTTNARGRGRQAEDALGSFSVRFPAASQTRWYVYAFYWLAPLVILSRRMKPRPTRLGIRTLITNSMSEALKAVVS